MLKNKDWVLRLKGKHAITVYADGLVSYSVDKKELFRLKKSALKELVNLVETYISSVCEQDLSVKDYQGNVIRYKSRNKIYTLHNVEAFTDAWKIIYSYDSVKDNLEDLRNLVYKTELQIVSECIIDELNDKVYINNSCLDCYADSNDIADSLFNIIITKDSKIYYDFTSIQRNNKIDNI